MELSKLNSHNLKYALINNSIAIGNDAVRVYSVENTDELYNNILAQEKDPQDIDELLIPYWAEVWPSAIALSYYLKEESIYLKNKTITEIGCGLGLPGIVAGKLGAKVIFTDIIPDALELTKKNWEENIKNKDASYIICDWRKSLPPEADIYLASDIAYESKQFEQHIVLIKKLLKDRATVILSEPDRTLAKPFIKLLLNNFHVKQKAYAIAGKISTKVSVYTLRSKND